jgi:hypothetical protein
MPRYTFFAHTLSRLALAQRAFSTDSVLPPFLANPGVHLANSPVVGRRSKELNQMRLAVQSLPVLQQLQWGIYDSKNYNLIPAEQSELANTLARELFMHYIRKYSFWGVTETNIVAWKNKKSGSYSNPNRCVPSLVPQWNVSVAIDVNGQNGSYFVPPHVVALHEVMHIEEMRKYTITTPKSIYQSNEILTTTKTILVLDEIYKTINGMSIKTEVDYGIKLSIGKKKIPIGSFANFYRHLESQHTTLASGIISDQSLDFLTEVSSAEPEYTRRLNLT